MTTYKRVYYEMEVQPEIHGSSPNTKLRLSYKGFEIVKPMEEFNLYCIATKYGFDIIPRLAGNWTKLETLKDAIDAIPCLYRWKTP